MKNEVFGDVLTVVVVVEMKMLKMCMAVIPIATMYLEMVLIAEHMGRIAT